MIKIADFAQKLKSPKAIMPLAALIIVLLLSLIWSGSQEKADIKGAEQLWQTAENIRKAFRLKPNYWGLNTALVLKDKLGADMPHKDGKLYNAWGKEVFVGAQNGDTVMPGQKDFYIIYDNLSKDECVLAISFMPDNQQSLGLLGLVVESALKTEFVWGGENALPIDKKAATQACGDNSKVLWHFE